VVEMKHNRKNSLCCGTPVLFSNRSLATKIGEERALEAEEASADAITHICTGCYVTLSKYTTEKNIKSYYVTELAQMAIGETPIIKILENQKEINSKIVNTFKANPNLMIEKYKIKNGKISRL
ncbi:MAG: heterodisulfide reductase-related iron-sulfur binding cluster, partial [Promethearchaeota archaeon]